MSEDFHIRPTCGIEFTGRLNRRFCNDDCKTAFNNAKAAILRRELVDNRILQKNFLILKELYPESRGTEPIDIKRLYSKGYVFEAPTRKVKTKKYGYECYLVHGYAFRFIKEKNNQFIIIYKIEDLVQKPDKLTTPRRFKLTMSGRSKLTTSRRSKLTT